MNKPMELKRPDYTIQINYTPEAAEKKLIKFVTNKSGDEFIISTDEVISFLVNQVNMSTLSPAFVETNKVNVVEVARQLECELDKDMKKGQKIRINYTHPYPVEFALIEEAYKIALIKKDTKVTELTKEYIDEVRNKITPGMKEYVEKLYKSFKNVKLL